MFNERSAKRLEGVNPQLVDILKEAQRRTGIPIQITEGVRDVERQKQLKAKGKSQTLNSYHIHGNAIDVHIPDGKGGVDWDFESYRPLGEAAKAIAAERGIKNFTWGGDWKSLRDGVHFQLGDSFQAAHGQSGQSGQDTLQGGEGNDRLQAVRDEIQRREKLEAVQAEIARRSGETDRANLANQQQTRVDVESALGQLKQEESKGLVEGAFDEFTSGVVGNFGDELEALERAVPSLFNDDNFLEQYQIALSEERDRSREFADENPVTATVANIGGALATGTAAVRRGATLAGATRTVPGAIGAGAVEGSLYGAIYGAGAAEGDINEVVGEALESGALGGLLGGIITGGVQRIANSRARTQVVRALKPTADLKVARNEAYQKVDSLGAFYRPQAVDSLIGKMEATLKRQSFNPDLHKGTSAAIQAAQATRGKPLTLTELDQLRQIIARDAGGSLVPADKGFAVDLINEVDDFIDRTVPRINSKSGGSGRKISRAIKTARRENAKFKKAETIDTLLLESADQAAASGSGGNINNVIRQKFVSILKSPKKRRGFSNEELGTMRRIVRGSPGDNILRLIGKLSPGGNGLMTALNLGAVAANPAMIGVSAAGAGAKVLADRGTQRGVQKLRTLVQTGDDLANTTRELTPEKRALLKVLAAEAGISLETGVLNTTQGQ